MQSEIDVIIRYRVSRAEEVLDEIELAIVNNKLHLAANRIYYSAFYITSALALKRGFKTSKHSQLLGWFNKEIVKMELVSKKFGNFYLDAFGMRQEGDYDDLVKFDLNYINEKYSLAKEFVYKVKELINP